jgi:simple sugar transport system permease protein
MEKTLQSAICVQKTGGKERSWMTIFGLLFNTSVFASALRLSTPILFGSIGGCYVKKAGIFFIAYESLMLISAFFSAWGSYIFSNPYLGMLCGIAAALVVGVVFGVLVLVFKSDSLLISIALNFGAWAISTQLLVSIFKTRGSYFDPAIVNYPALHFKFLEKAGGLNAILNDKVAIVYVAYLFILISFIIIYKTPFGLRLRSIGINEIASTSAGVNVNAHKWASLLFMSVALGIAGSYLPLSGVSMFSENMSAGRGNVCIAAVLVGNGNPLLTGLVALVFAYCSAMALTLTTFNIPTQLLQCIPYIFVILLFIANGIKNYIRRVEQ